jgi:hypothetical protein
MLRTTIGFIWVLGRCGVALALHAAKFMDVRVLCQSRHSNLPF